jgi:hypothetical protein
MKLPFMPAPFAIKPINIPAVAPEVKKPVQAVVPPVVKKPPVARVKKVAAAPVKEAIADKPATSGLDIESPLTIDDAISYIYAKSIEQLAKETGQSKKIVKKRIDALWNRDSLEERNGYYRYQNTASWKTSK